MNACTPHVLVTGASSGIVNRERQITELEQARLRRLPLAPQTSR
jgi:hypothetical protein